VRRLINSLQYTTGGSDDDEVQLVSHEAQQLKAGRRRSPNYVELASQLGPESMTGDVSILTTSQYIVPSHSTP